MNKKTIITILLALIAMAGQGQEIKMNFYRWIHMKSFFNKIYYAFSKTENGINLTNQKGDFSRGKIIEIVAGFELGIASALAAIPTLFFIRNYFDYIIIIPLFLFGVIFYFVRRYVKNYIWDEPDKNLCDQFEDSLNVLKWLIIGILTALCSFFCAIGGGIMFFLALFQCYT